MCEFSHCRPCRCGAPDFSPFSWRILRGVSALSAFSEHPPVCSIDVGKDCTVGRYESSERVHFEAATQRGIGTIKTMCCDKADNLGNRAPHFRKSGCMDTELRRASTVAGTRNPTLGISVFVQHFPHFESLRFPLAAYLTRAPNGAF